MWLLNKQGLVHWPRRAWGGQRGRLAAFWQVPSRFRWRPWRQVALCCAADGAARRHPLFNPALPSPALTPRGTHHHLPAPGEGPRAVRTGLWAAACQPQQGVHRNASAPSRPARGTSAVLLELTADRAPACRFPSRERSSKHASLNHGLQGTQPQVLHAPGVQRRAMGAAHVQRGTGRRRPPTRAHPPCPRSHTPTPSNMRQTSPLPCLPGIQQPILALFPSRLPRRPSRWPCCAWCCWPARGWLRPSPSAGRM